jgi:RimJ/RimL family protein N-acetyltransferase
MVIGAARGAAGRLDAPLDSVGLRPLEAADREAAIAWLDETTARRFLGGAVWLEAAEADPNIDCLIGCDGAGRPVVLLTCEHRGDNLLAVGICVDPARRRRGVGAAALRALIEHPDYADESVLLAVSDAANAACAACLQSVGFRLVDGDPSVGYSAWEWVRPWGT